MEHETKFRKMLFNEISLVISVVGCTMAVAFWIVNPQTALEKEVIKLQAQVESNQTVQAELQKIKNNDLHELNLSVARLEERDIAILQAIARVEALLNEVNKKR